MSSAAASAIRNGPIRPAIVFEFAMGCLPARWRSGTSPDRTQREALIRPGCASVRRRPPDSPERAKKNALRLFTMAQKLAAEEAMRSGAQQIAAMRDFRADVEGQGFRISDARQDRVADAAISA
jgi:hypothetical protein